VGEHLVKSASETSEVGSGGCLELVLPSRAALGTSGWAVSVLCIALED
jgi:hypothetical protein